MKINQVLALVSVVVVCVFGDTEADSNVDFLERHIGVNRVLKGASLGKGVSHRRKGVRRRRKMGRLPVEQHYPTVPVPPVPGSHTALPHEVLRHYQEKDEREDMLLSSPLRLQHSPTGTFPNLVLLLRFADHASRDLPSRDDISRLYNSEDFPLDDRQELVEENGGDDVRPTGSVRQVYFENSHSIFTVNTTVVDWITLNGTEAYYAAGKHGLSQSNFKEAMVEALDVLDNRADFDFAAFDLDENGALDGFGVLHSGYGAEFGGEDCNSGAEDLDRIWSHKGGFDWTSSDGAATAKRYYVSSALRGKCKSKIVRMGVLCHELGHYLGLPDLYDTTFKGKGLGAWDFMSQAWGWDGSGLFPSNLSAWSKMQLGWADADLIEADGTYELEAATLTEIKIYKITRNYPEGEYLLFENRQPIAYDTKIKQGGIAIYHVDETARNQRDCGFPSQEGWPENLLHYKVAMLAASGSYDLEEGKNQGDEQDLWHAGSVLKELGPGPLVYPNTDYYEKAGGEVGQTGIRIFGFSESGITMSFSVEGLSTRSPSELSTRSPSCAITESPVGAEGTTESPTHAPTRVTESPVAAEGTTESPTQAPTRFTESPVAAEGTTESPTHAPTRVTESPVAAEGITESPTHAPTRVTDNRENVKRQSPSRAPTGSPTKRRQDRKGTSAPTTTEEEEDPVHVPTLQSVVSLA